MLKKLKVRLVVPTITLLLLFFSSSVLAETTNYRTDLLQEIWQLHPNKTYEVDIINKKTPLTLLGVDMLANEQMTFFPDKEHLQLVESYLIQPDGTRIPLPAKSVYTRPSPLSITASGFTNSMVTTVIFPKLQPGYQRVTHWKLSRFKPDPFGIMIMQLPAFEAAVMRQEVIIHKPETLTLQWGKRGDYQVSTLQLPKETIIKAWLNNKSAESNEVAMTDEVDFQSLFVASSQKSWEDLGRTYYQLAQNKSAVTPEIQALAKSIVGNKIGLSAAKTLYNWTTANIHYVQLSLNAAGAYVPHSATEILNNRYGDCKDYATLLQALLKAVGIKSYTVLIDWGNLITQLPVPTPAQFNHAIIYLPEYRLFANPTDQTASFGVLDENLAHKFVVIGSEKGETTYTPLGKPEDNQYHLESDITLEENGEIRGQGIAWTTGTLNNQLRRTVNLTTSMQKWADSLLSDTLEGGTGIISVSDSHDLNHDMMTHIQWHSPFAFTLSKTIYFNVPYGIDYLSPNALRHTIMYTKRRYPATMMLSTLTWDYKIHLPKNYQAETMPLNVIFSNPAGSYKSTYAQSNDTIRVMRQLIIAKNYFKPEEYEYFNQLMFKMVSDTRSTLVLVKKRIV